MNYYIDFSDKAKKDIKEIKNSGNKVAFNKINSLLKELAEHPRTGTGHPEQLKGFTDVERWSRRITKKHRLIYDIKDDVVVVLIISAFGHYDDE
ncbi:MAG: Txe/YoeB family addiction module toxin [Bacteroidetes bacterium]|nr:Txe/YoeB family addiction module toxin [Bacteroidota bacterium]